ncbi:MAG TPA: hypothetical protein VFS43_32885 [Polyangiaceae bacterium]|nr:hypothetical protein [Polyangiaceae bacterium]
MKGGRAARRELVAAGRGRRARLAATFALAAALLWPSAARAAPDKPLVETVVLGLEAEVSNETAARSLTNALRQQVLDSEDYALRGESPSLVIKAGEAKCPLRRLKRPLHAGSDRVFDGPCLRRLGALLGTRRFFWGHFYNDGGRAVVKLHLWREGEPDRAVTLPDDEAARGRLAQRLYRKLTAPDKVGDITLTSGASLDGELFVDGRPYGLFASKAELTLPVGEHTLEVRQGGKPSARVRARVVAGRPYEVRLYPVTEAAPRPVARPVEVRPAPVASSPRTPWIWALGGVGAVGLIGAGAFFALYQGEQSGLGDACAPDKSCRGQQDAIDRSRLYSALSLVSLGVAAGAGAGAYIVWRAPRREATGAAFAPRAWAGVGPIGGGAAAFVRGEF